MEIYQPGAVVLQCGSDSLTGDRLGCFNLTLNGHGRCVTFMKKFNVPLLMVGGGGYTIRNVARCWTYETSLAIDMPVSNDLPYNDYFEFYGPDYKLHITQSNMTNQNTPEYLDKIKARLFENLRMVSHAPSVPLQDIPDDIQIQESDSEEEDNMDERITQRNRDRRIIPPNEHYDSDEDDEENRRIDPHNCARKRRYDEVHDITNAPTITTTNTSHTSSDQQGAISMDIDEEETSHHLSQVPISERSADERSECRTFSLMTSDDDHHSNNTQDEEGMDLT
ncbi:hypothetical protein GJ496_000183 [Pomphorhynchus laevis]|nr:hypothetical protein GJ496_000183 [Pomphorhynchus laevis]